MRERNYDRSEVLTMLDNLRELIGDSEVLENIGRYFSTDEVANCLISIANDFDVKEEMLENID